MALAYTSLCFCCGALVVGCGSRPRAWPGFAPVTVVLAHPVSSAFQPCWLHSLKCRPLLPEHSQAQLLPVLASRAFPHQLLLGELLPKPPFLLSLMPCCAFPQPALELLVLG